MKSIFPLIALLSIINIVYCMDRPVIGVLSQKLEPEQRHIGNKTYWSYIASSYVKFLESAGARVVPIWIGRERDYYQKVVDYTNGLLFPGGMVSFQNPDGYADAGKILYELAINKNRNGVYYPLIAICLGMELIPFIELDGKVILDRCNVIDVSLPVNFEPDFRSSRLFAQAPQELLTEMSTTNLTFNYHRFCLTETNLTKYRLDRKWKILSQNQDGHRNTFISSMENRIYPFYGLQFHPEKNPYIFIRKEKINHSENAVKMSQYFANFIVGEARKNEQSYPDEETEDDALIYNFEPIYVGKYKESLFEQIYAFTKDECDAQPIVQIH